MLTLELVIFQSLSDWSEHVHHVTVHTEVFLMALVLDTCSSGDDQSMTFRRLTTQLFVVSRRTVLIIESIPDNRYVSPSDSSFRDIHHVQTAITDVLSITARI